MGIPENMVEDVYTLRTHHLLHDPLDLGVVLLLDSDDLVVRKALFDARPAHVLEAVLVERELGLAPAHVMHDGRLRVRPNIGGGFAHGRFGKDDSRARGSRTNSAANGNVLPTKCLCNCLFVYRSVFHCVSAEAALACCHTTILLFVKSHGQVFSSQEFMHYTL